MIYESASIARIEGTNWRHGDIEDTLLNILMSRAAGGKKFSKMDVKRVYFGNWLRDYSQAVDVGTVKYVSAEAIRLILWVLGFMSFGYGTKEFEVTTDRLGCYRYFCPSRPVEVTSNHKHRPEEHIDNPKDVSSCTTPVAKISCVLKYEALPTLISERALKHYYLSCCCGDS